MADVGLRVLMVGGDAAEEAAVRLRLLRAGPLHRVVRVDRAQAAASLKSARWDLLLAGAQVPGLSATELAAQVRASGQDIPIVVVGDEADEATTVAWLEAGAFDFVTRPSFAGLWPVVARVEREHRDRELARERELRQRGSTASLHALAKSRTFDGSDPDAAYKEILKAGTLGAEALVAGIWRFDREAFVLRNLMQVDHRDGTWSKGFELKYSDFPDYFRALEDDQQIVAHDAFRDSRTAALSHAYLEPKRVCALLDTGVRIGGRLEGIICLEHGSGTRKWSADDQVFAAALAEATALVFEGMDRRRAEARADDSEDRFRELFQNSRDTIILYRVDENGALRAEDLNPAALALVPLTREQVLGKTPHEVLPRAAADLLTRRHRHVVKTLRPSTYEHRLELPNGPVWFNTALIPFIKDGKVQRIAAIARNVTDERTLEEQLAAARTLQALGQVAGHIAHDFNNLLQGVSGWATRLTSSADAEARESGEQILQAVARARGLTRQVLTFGQRELPTREALNLTELVTEAVKLLEPSLRPNLRVHVELQVDRTTTMGDAGQLHQVVLNLCTNALQAMPNGGRLTLRLEAVEVSPDFARAHPPLREGHHVRLQVEDTGHGMTPQVLKRIFEPFFTTKASGQGNGLGLAVVHGIVQGHGGAIAVTSAVGKGSTFEVFLPTFTPETKDSQVPGRGERVMLVDDQLNVARASSILFEQLGYRTTVFTDPREALAAFQREPGKFDLVMTDLTMPQMSGQELTTAVHALRADLPVIVTTGREVTEEDRKGLGVHTVMQKPWRIEDAVEALRRVMPQHQAPR